MIVKATDLANNLSLIGEVNLFKRKVSLIDKEKKVSKEFVSIPTDWCLFRVYNFPEMTGEKLDKAIHLQLSTDLPVSIDSVEFRYIVKKEKKNLKVFCIIVPKEKLEGFKGKVLDSEVLAISRLAVHTGKETVSILHFTKSYIVFIKLINGFPEVVRIVSKNQAESLLREEDVYISGFVKEDYKKVIKIESLDAKYNTCYGLMLRNFYDLAVDFGSGYSSNEVYNHIKAVAGITAILILLNVGFFSLLYFKEKVLKKIKSKEKEVYMMYVSSSETVFDPLLQVKGKLSEVKKKSEVVLDGVYILSLIGKAKKQAGLKHIKRITVNKTFIQIEGRADSISQVERFKNLLSSKLSMKITQTSKTPSGDVRFEMEGKLK